MSPAVAVAFSVEAAPDVAPDAPVVVLSNSLGSTRSMWDAQAGELARHFRVVRYDTRGHGASPVVKGPATIDDLVDDVVALLDRLELAHGHFVGLSLGAMTGMALAARHPARVDRLALLCTSAYLGPASAWEERAALVRASGTGAVADAVVARWYTAGFHVREPARIEAARAMVAATPAEGYASCCEAIATMDLRGDLPAIKAPTLVIAGAEDPATPPSHLREIAGAVTGAKLLVVADSAHLANDEQPAVVTSALTAHLLEGAEQMAPSSARRS